MTVPVDVTVDGQAYSIDVEALIRAVNALEAAWHPYEGPLTALDGAISSVVAVVEDGER